MMTARKRVGPLPTHRLAVRHFVDHSSSDLSSEASSDFHSNASSDSSLRHSLPDHSSLNLPSTFMGPSRKRLRSPMTFVPELPLISGALSPIRADLIPSPKRIRSPETATDLEGCSKDSFEPYVPREVGLGVDIEDESSEPSRSRGADLEMDVDVVRGDRIEIDPEIQAEIDECFAYANALRDGGIDARVVVEAIARDDVETGTRDPIIVSDDGDTPHVVPEVIPKPAQEGEAGSTYETLGDLVQRFHDHTQAIPVHRIQVIDGVQREQGHRIVGVESIITALTKRVAELERDNRRPRDTASVKSQRVDRLQRGMSRMQREPRQLRQFRFYDRVTEEMQMEEMEEMEMEGMEKTEMEIEIRIMDNALTWWNYHKRTIGVDAAYAMNWAGLMRLMTEVYCPRNEIQKIETELWNLTKLQGYAARSAKNKRRMESNLRDNCGQQPPFKRQNVSGQNVARAYPAGNNEKRGELDTRREIVDLQLLFQTRKKPHLGINKMLFAMSVEDRDM
ncbi:hypothetical protein Tco_1363423 [Tanacetum coccineum]